jgi:hypothetical protein
MVKGAARGGVRWRARVGGGVLSFSLRLYLCSVFFALFLICGFFWLSYGGFIDRKW